MKERIELGKEIRNDGEINIKDRGNKWKADGEGKKE